MTREQVDDIIEKLGLIDLGDAILYLDEEGHIEAAFSKHMVNLEKKILTTVP